MESSVAVSVASSSPPLPSKPPDPCSVSSLPPNPPVPPVPPDPPPESLLCSPASSPHLAVPPHRCSLKLVGHYAGPNFRFLCPSRLPYIQPLSAPATNVSPAQPPSHGFASPPPPFIISDLPLSTAPSRLCLGSPSLVGTFVEFEVLYGSETLVDYIKLGVVLLIPPCCQHSPAFQSDKAMVVLWFRVFWLSSSSLASISVPFFQVFQSYPLSCFLDMEFSRLCRDDLAAIMLYLSSCAPILTGPTCLTSYFVPLLGISTAPMRPLTAVCRLRSYFALTVMSGFPSSEWQFEVKILRNYCSSVIMVLLDFDSPDFYIFEFIILPNSSYGLSVIGSTMSQVVPSGIELLMFIIPRSSIGIVDGLALTTPEALFPPCGFFEDGKEKEVFFFSCFSMDATSVEPVCSRLSCFLMFSFIACSVNMCADALVYLALSSRLYPLTIEVELF